MSSPSAGVEGGVGHTFSKLSSLASSQPEEEAEKSHESVGLGVVSAVCSFCQ